jgi:hypothetical protein
LTVSLSSPATTNTFVGINSGSPGNLTVVGGGVTVPSGQLTAPVLVNGIAQALSVQLTATLASNSLNANVRVVGPTELPQVVSVDPPSTNVAPQGMAALTVFLDIPAQNPGGNTVSLSLNPNMFGTIPPTVFVAADQISASFNFTAGMNEGTETLTALLNGGMATSTVDVTAGGGLVINEVDYDQISTDTDEYVEILNTTSAPVNLSGIALVLVNGSNSTEYNRIPLAAAGTLAPGEYLVIGSATALATVQGTPKTIAFAAAENNLQNGAPDALGILDVASGTLIDALSYEGSITMGNVMGVPTPLNFVEGAATSATDSNTSVLSLARLPNGADSNDAATDWATTTTLTPGVANVP